MWALSETKWVGQRDQNSGPLHSSVVSVLFSLTYFRNLHQNATLMPFFERCQLFDNYDYKLEIFYFVELESELSNCFSESLC